VKENTFWRDLLLFSSRNIAYSSSLHNAKSEEEMETFVPLVLYRFETWYLTLRGKYKLQIYRSFKSKWPGKDLK
jgi:hypothetical protein